MAVILGCDVNSLIKNAACFNGCIGTLQTQAALVYLMEQRRAQLSGTAVRTPNQLRAAAACFRCTAIDPVADGLDVSVAQEGYIIAGGSIQSVQQVISASKAFFSMSLSELRAIEIQIWCALQSF